MPICKSQFNQILPHSESGIKKSVSIIFGFEPNQKCKDHESITSEYQEVSKSEWSSPVYRWGVIQIHLDQRWQKNDQVWLNHDSDVHWKCEEIEDENNNFA